MVNYVFVCFRTLRNPDIFSTGLKLSCTGSWFLATKLVGISALMSLILLPPCARNHPLFSNGTSAARHLLISYPALMDRELEPFLVLCTGVTSIMVVAYNFRPALIPILSAMPLRRLCIDFTTALAPSLALTDSFFSRITHLELLDAIDGDEWGKWSGLAHMAQRTHLAFNHLPSTAILTGVLVSCASLQLLVVLYYSRSDLEDIRIGNHVSESVVQDLRFVMTLCDSFRVYDDWQIGAWGGYDYWRRAEEFVSKRRSGEVERFNCMLLD
ncbi:hypothetical protein B0H10DRAFT_1986546 [Mycena sp. CBHHK59/15]|nr:hypothetical protein B0H10DRAFT_1986546 [Mycena sp. CBHHK59/15]